jgi:hypothetical protein
MHGSAEDGKEIKRKDIVQFGHPDKWGNYKECNLKDWQTSLLLLISCISILFVESLASFLAALKALLAYDSTPGSSNEYLSLPRELPFSTPPSNQTSQFYVKYITNNAKNQQDR